MKPWCHNRPDREEVGRWVDTGRRAMATSRVLRLTGYGLAGQYLKCGGRPILRYRRAFHDINACMAYAVPEGTVPAPVLSGWDCSACRHKPKDVK